MAEIEHEIERDVVKRLFRLIRFRNEYPAFDGDFEVLGNEYDRICLVWQNDEKKCSLQVDLKTNQSVIEYIDQQGEMVKYLI